MFNMCSSWLVAILLMTALNMPTFALFTPTLLRSLTVDRCVPINRHFDVRNSARSRFRISPPQHTCASPMVPALYSYTGDENDIFYRETRASGNSVLAKIKAFIVKVGDPVQRREWQDIIQRDITLIYTSFLKNVNDRSSLLPRGEEHILWKVGLWALIWLGVHPIVSLVIQATGMASFALGFYFIVDSIWSLKSNFSPFISPASDNYLVTTNSYSMVRHPLYGGIFMTCLGHAIAEYSADKVVLAMALAYVLNLAADKEEDLLRQKHPLSYVAYSLNKKKFLPGLL